MATCADCRNKFLVSEIETHFKECVRLKSWKNTTGNIQREISVTVNTNQQLELTTTMDCIVPIYRLHQGYLGN